MTSTKYCTIRVLLLYRRSRCCFASSWLGPIKTALKRLKLPTVLPGAASTLSASSAYLFLCRVSDAFPSSLTLAAINLPTNPFAYTVLYYTPGCSVVVLQFPRCQTPDDPLPRMQLLIYSPARFDGGLVCRRGCGCSVTCTTTVK